MFLYKILEEKKAQLKNRAASAALAWFSTSVFYLIYFRLRNQLGRQTNNRNICMHPEKWGEVIKKPSTKYKKKVNPIEFNIF